MGSIGALVKPLDSRYPSDVGLRDARTSELDAVARLLAEVYGAFEAHLPAQAWARYIGEIVDVRSRLGASELIVAEQAGQLAGTIGFFPEASRSALERWPAGWASIRSLGVRADTRRRGIGTALAGEAVRRARERKAKAIGLHTAAHMAAATPVRAARLSPRARVRHRDRRDVHRPGAAIRRELAGAGVPARPRGGLR
jgi:GNAT superfamily N-acetyltransferase